MHRYNVVINTIRDIYEADVIASEINEAIKYVVDYLMFIDMSSNILGTNFIVNFDTQVSLPDIVDIRIRRYSVMTGFEDIKFRLKSMVRINKDPVYRGYGIVTIVPVRWIPWDEDYKRLDIEDFEKAVLRNLSNILSCDVTV